MSKKMQNRALKHSENIAIVEQRELHSGPLPHPDVMRGYEEILPGTAERLLNLAESQATHRQIIEAKVVNTQTRNSTLGIISAFTLCLLTIVLGTILSFNGQPFSGTVLGLTGIGSVVGVFIRGTSIKKKDD